MSDIEITIEEQTIEVTIEGGIGPQGPQGPAGPQGSSTVVFEQQIAADHWVVTHSWPGGYPSVTVVDSSGAVVEGDVQYTNDTQIDLYFSSPFSGKVYLN